MGGIEILRDDGTLWSHSWSIQGNGLGQPVLADVDGDGYPDILAVESHITRLNGDGGYHSIYLVAFRRDGAELGRWPLPGIGGAQASCGLPLVGDFDGDGRTEMVATYPLIDGGGFSGLLEDGALTVLSIGAPFSAESSPWSCNNLDPQNTRTLREPFVAPAITTQPRWPVPAEVRFSVETEGYPAPTHQWQISGAGGEGWTDIADGGCYDGARRRTLALVGEVPAALKGRGFRCVVANRLGFVVSEVAVLEGGTPLETWRTRYFGTNQPIGSAADANDPDCDGRANIMKYALGSVPTTADKGSGAAAGSVTDGAGTHLTLTFNRIEDPSLTYAVEASDDLAGWSQIWTCTAAQNVAGLVVVTDAETVENHPRRFLRLRVTN